MLVEEHEIGPSGARLGCYVLDPGISHAAKLRRPCVVICPGGAFLRLAHREAEPVAARFLGLGYHAFICRYPVAEEGLREGRGCMEDATVSLMRACAFVRRHAEKWMVDPERIYVLGFSAGGYVALSLAERWDDPLLLEAAGATAEETKPRGTLLAYPMVSATIAEDAFRKAADRDGQAYAELLSRAVFGKAAPSPEDFAAKDLVRRVRPDMPRTFIWQTAQETTLRVAETADLVAELLRAGVPTEFHLFQEGIHGMSLADETSVSKPEDRNSRAAAWVPLAASWLALDGPPEIVL